MVGEGEGVPDVQAGDREAARVIPSSKERRRELFLFPYMKSPERKETARQKSIASKFTGTDE
jgi:hypothetical protein